jgi:uncharacterized protein
VGRKVQLKGGRPVEVYGYLLVVRVANRRVIAAGLAAVMVMLVVVQGVVSEAYSSTVRLGLLAVKETNHGMEGEVIGAILRLEWPGNGEVYVVDSGGVGNSTLYSTVEAFIVAALLSGVSPFNYKLTVSFETSERVSGPSASGFIATALLLLFRGLHPSNTTTMTGMVSLTGFVLPVSGVKYKVEAASEKGYTTVIVPLTNYRRLKGPLAGAGGVRVEPVCDIESAAEILASIGPIWPSVHVNTTLLRERVWGTLKLFTSYAALFRNATLALQRYLPRNTSPTLLQLINLSRQLDSIDPYASASAAFMAAFTAATTAARLEGLSAVEKAFNMTLEEAIAKAREAVAKAYERFRGRSLCGLWGFEALEAAKLRLYFAERAMRVGKPDYKAIALVRAISAASWAEAADPTLGPLVNCTSLLSSSAASTIVYYLNNSYRYLESIMGKYVNITRMAYGGYLSGWVEDVYRSLKSGDTVLAMGLSTYIISDAETRLVEGSGIPSSCAVERFERILSYTLARGVPSLHAVITYLYLVDAADNITRIVGGDDAIKTDLAVSGISWSLQALMLSHPIPQNTTAGRAAPVQAVAAQPAGFSVRCIIGLAVLGVTLAASSYIAYTLSSRFRGEKI